MGEGRRRGSLVSAPFSPLPPPPPSRLTVSARLSTSATESRRRVSLVLPKDNPPQPLALHPGIHSPVKCTNIPIFILRRSAEENGTALQKAACLAACLKPSCVELTLCPTTESIRKGRRISSQSWETYRWLCAALSDITKRRHRCSAACALPSGLGNRIKLRGNK